MAAYFFDSSAVVKLYVTETGTGWVQTLLDAAGLNQIGIVTICGAEVVAAITRRVRGNAMSPTEASRAIHDFQSDFHTEFDRIEVTTALVREAMRLAEKHGLRGYDAVQLAGASSMVPRRARSDRWQRW